MIRRRAERKIYQVQSRLERYSVKQNLEMGTTLSLLVIWEKKYLLWHLGDSRIYRISGKKRVKTRQLTVDHADAHKRLTKCVGSFGFFLPDFKMGTVKKNEAFLICSDGFWNKITINEIGEVLSPSG